MNDPVNRWAIEIPGSLRLKLYYQWFNGFNDREDDNMCVYFTKCLKDLYPTIQCWVVKVPISFCDNYKSYICFESESDMVKFKLMQ